MVPTDFSGSEGISFAAPEAIVVVAVVLDADNESRDDRLVLWVVCENSFLLEGWSNGIESDRRKREEALYFRGTPVCSK